jgi:hypothetical protein
MHFDGLIPPFALFHRIFLFNKKQSLRISIGRKLEQFLSAYNTMLPWFAEECGFNV